MREWGRRGGGTCCLAISEVRAREEADLAERQGHQEESHRDWATNFLLHIAALRYSWAVSLGRLPPRRAAQFRTLILGLWRH